MSDTTTLPGTRSVTLEVQGMTCGSCEARIRGALAALPEAANPRIDRTTGTVTVDSTLGAGADQAIAEAITLAGYPARLT